MCHWNVIVVRESLIKNGDKTDIKFWKRNLGLILSTSLVSIKFGLLDFSMSGFILLLHDTIKLVFYWHTSKILNLTGCKRLKSSDSYQRKLLGLHRQGIQKESQQEKSSSDDDRWILNNRYQSVSIFFNVWR